MSCSFTFVQKDGDYEKNTGLCGVLDMLGDIIEKDDSKVIYIFPC